MTSLVTMRIELSVDCGRCFRPVVLSALSERVTCRSCLHELTFHAAGWPCAAAAFDEALRGEHGSRRFVAELGPEYKVVVRAPLERAVCGCGAVIDEVTLVAAIGREVACACGRSMAVRAPDAAVLAMAPSARAVANERRDVQPRPAPVAFRCACGATLRADGAARAVACSACGLVDVPEPLWNELRPILQRAPIFLVVAQRAP